MSGARAGRGSAIGKLHVRTANEHSIDVRTRRRANRLDIGVRWCNDDGAARSFQRCASYRVHPRIYHQHRQRARRRTRRRHGASSRRSDTRRGHSMDANQTVLYASTYLAQSSRVSQATRRGSTRPSWLAAAAHAREGADGPTFCCRPRFVEIVLVLSHLSVLVFLSHRLLPSHSRPGVARRRRSAHNPRRAHQRPRTPPRTEARRTLQYSWVCTP